MNDEELEAARFRAYQIWDREGRPHGRHEEHWLQALKELGLDKPDADEVREAIAAQTRKWDSAEEEQ
jgi:hypothetical protein